MSTLVNHAKRELELLGEDQETIRGYLRVVSAFAKMNHSGMSAAIAIPTLNKLFQFENLVALTDDPNEWFFHGEEVWGKPGGIWQGIRNSAAFSTDGGKTYSLVDDEPNEDGVMPLYETVRVGPDAVTYEPEVVNAD